MALRKCITCGEEKPEEQFSKSNKGRNGRRNLCKPCDNKRTRDRVHQSPETVLRRRFVDLRARVKRRKEKLDITPEDLITLYKKQHGLCALTGMPMSWSNDGEHSNSATRRGTSISVDRIDSTLGYTRDNIRLVCERANKVKGNMDDGELYFWCRQISFYLNSFPESD